jgi:hypothetical protein
MSAKAEVWQGTLALMVVKTLSAMGPQHGYGIAGRIEQTRCADDERHGLGFGFAHGLGRWSIVATLVKELVCEFVDEHRRRIRWRERLEDRDAAWL